VNVRALCGNLTVKKMGSSVRPTFTIGLQMLVAEVFEGYLSNTDLRYD